MIERRKVLKGIGLTIGAAGMSLAGHPWTRCRAIDRKGVDQGRLLVARLVVCGDISRRAAGLWAKNGLEAEVKQVQGGPLAMVALTNREAQFAGVASTDPVVGWDKGIKTLAISAFTGSLDMQITARNDWMARVGVTPKSSLERKAEGVQGRPRRLIDDRRRAGAIHPLSGPDRSGSIPIAT